jgi:hypothetical protein
VIRVIIKHPGYHAEVIEIDGARETLVRLIGGEIDPLLAIVTPGAGVLSMYGHAQPPPTARPNIVHPADPTSRVFGTVIWIEGTDDGHPRPIRVADAPHLLTFIRSLAPADDQPDCAN